LPFTFCLRGNIVPPPAITTSCQTALLQYHISTSAQRLIHITDPNTYTLYHPRRIHLHNREGAFLCHHRSGSSHFTRSWRWFLYPHL